MMQLNWLIDPSEIHVACATGDLKRLNALLEAGNDPCELCHVYHYLPVPPLLIAIEYNQNEILNRLLDFPKVVEQIAHNNNLPLKFAVGRNIDTVKRLLKYPAVLAELEKDEGNIFGYVRSCPNEKEVEAVLLEVDAIRKYQLSRHNGRHELPGYSMDRYRQAEQAQKVAEKKGMSWLGSYLAQYLEDIPMTPTDVGAEVISQDPELRMAFITAFKEAKYAAIPNQEVAVNMAVPASVSKAKL